MFPWFTWKYGILTITSLCLFIVLLHRVFNSRFYVLKRSFFVLFLFLFLIVWWTSLDANLLGKINAGLTFLIMSLVICLKDDCKIELFNYITKWFAILLGVSLLFYILFLLRIPLRNFAIAYNESLHSNYIFDNYYAFIVPSYRLLFYTRFQSVFLEPGHLTMGLAVLLFVNKYNIKNKYVLILILAQIFTLSLAGYIVMIVGFLTQFFISNKIGKEAVKKMIFAIFIAISGYYVINNIFSDNAIETAILERLEFSNETIAGNNRTSISFDNIYKQVIESPNKWTGIEWNQYAYDGNSGVKKYLVTYGIIGIVFVLLFYISFAFFYRNKKVFALVFITLLLLYQNAYPLWWCVCLCVILGTPYLRKE